MPKPIKPEFFTDEQWARYVAKFQVTYESYRIGGFVWLCRWGYDERIKADSIQALAHEHLIRTNSQQRPKTLNRGTP